MREEPRKPSKNASDTPPPKKSEPQHERDLLSASGDEFSENDEQDEHGSSDINLPLPEVMTKGIRATSIWAGKAALANDWFSIEKVLGQHDTNKYAPQSVTFVRAPGGSGNINDRKRVERGLLLMPRTEPSPTSSASGDIAAEVQGGMLERSTLFRDGIFTNVEETNEYIKVSGRLRI